MILGSGVKMHYAIFSLNLIIIFQRLLIFLYIGRLLLFIYYRILLLSPLQKNPIVNTSLKYFISCPGIPMSFLTVSESIYYLLTLMIFPFTQHYFISMVLVIYNFISCHNCFYKLNI